MLNQGLIDMAGVRTVVASSPFANSDLVDKCDGRAQSGLETLTRLRLRALRIKLDVQVWIDSVGFVDLLVGDRLVIETDGHRFHQDFHADRERDLTLKNLGYDVVRLTAQHVLDDWDATVEKIMVIIRRRQHIVRSGKAG